MSVLPQAVLRPREPFLDVHSYKSMFDYWEQRRLPALRNALDESNVAPEDLANVKRQIFDNEWRIALLCYSGGGRLQEMSARLSQAICSFELWINDDQASLDLVDISIQTYYVEAIWLLSLAALSGSGESQIERVANFYAADETNDGADELFELILAKLGRKSFEAEGLMHEDPYRLLLGCVKAEPPDRPALMTKFLKRWFKGQKECDWWGSHIPRKGTTVLDTGFFGYWAFEAALVTYLWDIDDRSYRDLPHYPKDLVDYARANALRPSDGQPPSRVMAGDPCPRAGWWMTPARVDSRRRFDTGEHMPNLGGDYGAIIWQWDDNQTL